MAYCKTRTYTFLARAEVTFHEICDGIDDPFETHATEKNAWDSVMDCRAKDFDWQLLKVEDGQHEPE